jgi:hypothetical protein
MATVVPFPNGFQELNEFDRLRLCDAVERLDVVLRCLPFARKPSDHFVALARLLRGLPVDARRVVVENLEMLTQGEY